MNEISINFNQLKTLTEQQLLQDGFLRAFGHQIQSILKAMFGGYTVPVNVRGNRSQINAFADTLNSEKGYIDAYRKYGLDNPSTYRSKFQLNKAITDFERKTGLLWPLK